MLVGTRVVAMGIVRRDNKENVVKWAECGYMLERKLKDMLIEEMNYSVMFVALLKKKFDGG